MNEDILKMKEEVHKKYCELMEQNKNTNQTICEVLDLISAMRDEMKSLRTDVDKLIENNQGGTRYERRTA